MLVQTSEAHAMALTGNALCYEGLQAQNKADGAYHRAVIDVSDFLVLPVLEAFCFVAVSISFPLLCL